MWKEISHTCTQKVMPNGTRKSVIKTGGGARNSPTQGLRSPTGGLNLGGHDRAPFIISLFEGCKHHFIFRKNNHYN